jgi:membrane carboxypeptidase/penicillin-binding protein
MKAIHEKLPPEKFTRPETGLVTVNVSASSGLLPTEYSKRIYPELFLAGTEPKTFDEIDQYEYNRQKEIEENLIRSQQDGGIIPDDPQILLPSLDGTGAGSTAPNSGNPLLD